MPLQATSGAASYDAFGGGVAGPPPNYIEDVFSTWLYTGNSSTQTITNGIDLAGEGGLVWLKSRSAAYSHRLVDTARGATKELYSNATSAQGTDAAGLTAFTSTGFTLGNSYSDTETWATWTFRKQPKFFQVVTWTGNSTYPRTITHNLGSAPGFITTKNTTEGSDWFSYHTSLGNFQALRLNTTATPFVSSNNMWNVTSTSFTLTSDLGMNESGSTYVAYLFAHNAGGFGLTGTDNVISCGSYTGTGAAGNAQTLGYEPQWLMVKKTTSATQSDWVIFDNMRGWPVAGSADNYLWANSSNAEGSASSGWVSPNATGFQFDDGQNRVNGSGETYIYIAIRRGPMKVPTDATKVFSSVTSMDTNSVVNSSAPVVDLAINKFWYLNDNNSPVTGTNYFVDRLRGLRSLESTNTDAEKANQTLIAGFDRQSGMRLTIQNTGFSNFFWMFRRAPGFFDEVCYTGNYAGNPQIPHNLTVAPELIIVKGRSDAGAWYINSPLIGTNFQLAFNTSAKSASSTYTLTSTYFQNPDINYPTGGTFVAYLFASCPGVSKVGSYTGTGTTFQVNCGFTSGARFVLIKRTDSTGDWYVWDRARGIVAGDDPYLLLNSTAAEVTNTDYVDTYSAGFEISSTAPAAINASGGTYIFLAIA